MKDFYGDYVQDPIIEDVHNNDNDLSGKMFKFSSGYAVFVGIYTTKNSTFTKQGNISLGAVETISIRELGFTTVLGGSVAKNGYNANNGVFGSGFDQNNVLINMFRGDDFMNTNANVSIIVFGLWK